MIYLVAEILVCLLAALAVGLALGWRLSRIGTTSVLARRESEFDTQLARLTRERDELRMAHDVKLDELRQLAEDQDQARRQYETAASDLASVVAERDRALTRAVKLQEEVEALGEAYRDRSETVRRLQDAARASDEARTAEVNAQFQSLRKECDRLRRELESRPPADDAVRR